MKKIVVLLSAFVLLTAFTCENEPLDDGLLNVVEDPNGPVNGNLVGEWQLESFDYTGTSTTTIQGVSTVSNFTCTSINEDFIVGFNADGTYYTNGSYDIDLEFSIESFPSQSFVVPISSSGEGTYTSTATTFTADGSIFEISMDGQPQPDELVEESTSDYTLSNDGNTLTFTSGQTQNINQDGINALVSVNSTVVLTRVGGGTVSNTDLVGTWLLTAWNAEDEPVDINNDGTPSTNLLDEIDCYTNETLVFNADGTGTNNSTSYADFEFDIVVGTTNEFNYTVDCIEEEEITNITWSQDGNTVTIADDFGSYDWTLNGDQLSILIPDGFIAFDSEDVEVSTSQDLTFVYTKQ